MLKQVAQIMEEELDEIGMTGTYGGEELVKQADQAMYISKTTDKNKVTAYKAAEVKKSVQHTYNKHAVCHLLL
ncbi:hypothetical protein [Paenibacillus sp. NPDC055715]